MPTAFFQVCLSVQPTRGGEAEIGVPQALRGLNYGFVIVKDGGQEGIIKIEGAETLLRQVEKDHDCKKLTAKQAEALQGGYPQPKIKKRYRARPQPQGASELEPVGAIFDADEAGRPIVDAVQTVRAGFYLIDVPILSASRVKS
jgi:hypothetical protein